MSKTISQSVPNSIPDKKGFGYTGVLISLRAGHMSDRMMDKALRALTSKESGLDEDVLGTSKRILPKGLIPKIRKQYSIARKEIVDLCIPWTCNEVDEKGSRKEDARWLVLNKHLPRVEDTLNKCRVAREILVDKLCEKWPVILDKMKEELTDEKTGKCWFNPDDYPRDVEEVRKKFHWTVRLEPVPTADEQEADIRLKLPKEYAERAIEQARDEERARIANVFTATALRIAEWTSLARDGKEGDGGVAGYTPLAEGETDGRKGDTLPKRPRWKEMDLHISIAENINETLKDPAIAEAVKKMKTLQKRLFPKGEDFDESYENMREELKSSPEARDELVQEINEIEEAVTPAFDQRFNDLMS